jgi:hypothetical protein
LLEDDELWKLTFTDQIGVERERLRNPEKEAEAWQRLIGDIDQKRDRMIDMATDATIHKKDVRVKLPELDKQNKEAQQELARVMDRRQQEKELDDLEADILKDPEVPYVQILWPEQEILWPERNEEDPTGYRKILQQLGLKAIKYMDGTLELVGDYGPLISKECTLPRCTASATTSSSSTPASSRVRTCPPSPGESATGTLGSGRTGYSCRPPQKSPT